MDIGKFEERTEDLVYHVGGIVMEKWFSFRIFKMATNETIITIEADLEEEKGKVYVGLCEKGAIIPITKPTKDLGLYIQKTLHGMIRGESGCLNFINYNTENEVVTDFVDIAYTQGCLHICLRNGFSYCINQFVTFKPVLGQYTAIVKDDLADTGKKILVKHHIISTFEPEVENPVLLEIMVSAESKNIKIMHHEMLLTGKTTHSMAVSIELYMDYITGLPVNSDLSGPRYFTVVASTYEGACPWTYSRVVVHLSYDENVIVITTIPISNNGIPSGGAITQMIDLNKEKIIRIEQPEI